MIIVPLSEKILHQVYLLQKYTDDGWSELQLEGELKNPCAIGLCAMNGDEITAYLSCHAVCDEANLNNIITDVRFRGRGIAKSLLTELDKVLVSKGVNHLYLEVRSKNIAAISLYESLGFTCIGARKGFYINPNDDAFLYKKEMIEG